MYDISVLANVPNAVSLVSPSAPSRRLRCLFTIGVHDIPFLEEDLKASTVPIVSGSHDNVEDEVQEMCCGWIACTTDAILATKDKLYDVLITMPPGYSKDAQRKIWPKVVTHRGAMIKATQRDVRRYRSMMHKLIQGSHERVSAAGETSNNETMSRRSSISSCTSPIRWPYQDIPDIDEVSEPISWSALAYSGFIWWASAGERNLALDSESEADAALLSDLAGPNSFESMSTLKHGYDAAKPEMAIIAYFHRLSTLLLTMLSGLIEDMDEVEGDDNALLLGQGDNGELRESLVVSGEAVAEMGLDVWSQADHSFIQQVVRAYYGRTAVVEGRIIDVCGVRIC